MGMDGGTQGYGTIPSAMAMQQEHESLMISLLNDSLMHSTGSTNANLNPNPNGHGHGHGGHLRSPARAIVPGADRSALSGFSVGGASGGMSSLSALGLGLGEDASIVSATERLNR